jgi:hypothetical protein
MVFWRALARDLLPDDPENALREALELGAYPDYEDQMDQDDHGYDDEVAILDALVPFVKDAILRG